MGRVASTLPVVFRIFARACIAVTRTGPVMFRPTRLAGTLGNMCEEAHHIAMNTEARKQNAGGPKKQRTSLRRDVQEAIDRAWPDGLVELSFDPDESYFCEVHPKLSQAFQRIPHAQLLQEREAEGGPIWWDNSDPEEDPPDEHKRAHSYHLFFVSPEDAAFRFETEA